MKFLALLLLACAALPARAEVKSTTAQGFEVIQTVTVAAPAAKVYKMLFQPGKWWNSDHTYSGSAANLSIEQKIGGCFCEKLPDGGGVQHLTVVFLAPDATVGLRGALGPLAAEGVDGTLFWSLTPAKDGGTTIVQKYAVGGFLHGDPAGWAGKVDAVLQEQLTRLSRIVDTGSPEPRKAP
jgi:uncharacterized protein YndB with AHSA1/START domain